jgi:hypothetical protein
MDKPTREELIEVATGLHDVTGCSCDRRYLMSCPNMANAVLQAGKVIRERPAP